MAIGMVWHDVDPPNSSKEVSDAIFLVTLAHKIGLQKINLQNRGEWLWRWTFLKATDGYLRYETCDASCAEVAAALEASRIAGFLDRFRGVTIKGLVGDCSRDEFIAETIEDVTTTARDLADIAVEENSESPV